MVTLKDIASELDVSIPLVSKVLNHSQGTTGVSKQTAARIREAARRLGYKRNRSAAALRLGRQNTLGVMIHRCGAAGSGLADTILAGVSAEAAGRGQQLELLFYETDEQFRASLDRMSRAAVDGLVVTGVTHPSVVDDLLDVQRGGVPVVTIHSYPLHDDIPNAGCDDVEIGRVAARHLIDLGCRRIAHIRSFDERYEGYRRALAEAGMELIDDLVYDARNPEGVDFGAGVAAADRFMDLGLEFDGLVAGCDLHAMGAIRALFRRGRNVPGDVRVAGVDNSPVCPFGVVALSSVSGDVAERARRAVRLLLDARDGKTVASFNVEPILHARESSVGVS